MNGLTDEKEKKSGCEKNLASVPSQEKNLNLKDNARNKENPINEEKIRNFDRLGNENGENEGKDRNEKKEKKEGKDLGFGGNMNEEMKKNKKENVRNTKERLVITEFKKKIKKVIFKNKNAKNYQRKVSKIVIKKFEHEVNVSEDNARAEVN